jgi:hypothetical protein
MTIGFSDGTSYGSAVDFHLDKPIEQEDNSYHKELSEGGEQKLNIDREHHVPLLASAIMGDDGNMTGLAIDHRVRTTPDQDQLLHLHEATELPYMNDLIKGGMSPPDAYGEAHKWATARETAASVAKWGPEGHEAYKAAMRDNAAIASEPSDRERHPDAHTTRYALDEHELGHQILQINPMEMKPGTTVQIGGGKIGTKPSPYGKEGEGPKAANVNKPIQSINEYVRNKTLSKWQKVEEEMSKLSPDMQKYIKALGKQLGFPTSLSDSLAMKQRSKLKVIEGDKNEP